MLTEYNVTPPTYPDATKHGRLQTDVNGRLIVSGPVGEANLALIAGYLDGVEPKLDTLITAAQDTNPVDVRDSGGAVVDVSWTVDTAALTAGDVMVTAPLEITNFFPSATGVLKVVGMVVHDADDQGIGFDLYFQNASQSLGTQNAAPTITDANGETIIGVIPVDASDYYDLGLFRKALIGRERTIVLKGGGVSTSVWISGVTRGAPTYAGGVLKLKIWTERA